MPMDSTNKISKTVDLTDDNSVSQSSLSSAILPTYFSRPTKFKNCRVRHSAQDLYETMEEALSPLLPFITFYKKGIVFEPCCGNSAITNYLREKGFEQIIERDLFTHPGKHDFITSDIPEHDLIITNPPFCTKHKIVKRIVESRLKAILLMPVSYLSTVSGRRLLLKCSSLKLFIIGRVPFRHNGKIMQVQPEVAWYFINVFEESRIIQMILHEPNPLFNEDEENDNSNNSMAIEEATDDGYEGESELIDSVNYFVSEN